MSPIYQNEAMKLNLIQSLTQADSQKTFTQILDKFSKKCRYATTSWFSTSTTTTILLLWGKIRVYMYLCMYT